MAKPFEAKLLRGHTIAIIIAHAQMACPSHVATLQVLQNS